MKKAFTLMEMLVALILISLLIGVAVFAFRLQLITIYKTKTEGLNSVIKYTQTRALIESIKYYVVEEYDRLNMPMKELHYFFYGDQSQMKFITTNAIHSSGDTLVALTCKDGKLIYKEEPLFKRMNYLRPEFLDDSTKYVLYDNLEECSFKYKIITKSVLPKLKNSIPKAIVIKLKENNKNKTIYASIKMDDNRTWEKVYHAMYPEN